MALASGDAVTMGFEGDRLINFAIDTPTSTPGLDQNGKPLKEGVKNLGQVTANGGAIWVSAAAAESVLDHSINMQGIAEVRSVAEKNGEIILSSDSMQGVVSVSGTLDASGKISGQRGGEINITGYNILLDTPTVLDVSGDIKGGNINVGGNYQGKGLLPHANATVLMPKATLLADALTGGDGGQVVLWSDNVTRAYGNISAKGGSNSGNGGVIETSSHGFLDTSGLLANTSAARGKTGTWLLDPFDVTICGGCATSGGSFSGGIFTPTSNSADVSDTDIANNLATSNVTINTGSSGSQNGNILSGAAISITWSSDNSLTFNAAGNITANGTAENTTSQTAGITLTAGGTITYNANTTVNGLASLSGTTVTVNTNTGTLRSMSITGTTNIILNAPITTAGSQTYTGPVQFGVGVTGVSVTGNGANITFTGTTTANMTNFNGATLTGASDGSSTLYFLNTQSNAVAWNITDNNSGTINNLDNSATINFSQFGNLAGSYVNPNTFTFSDGKTLTGSVDGSYGGTTSKTQTLTYSQYTTAVTATLSSATAGSTKNSAGNTINSFAGINTYTGNQPNASSSIVIASGVSLTSSSTGTYSGTIGSSTFSGFSFTNGTPSNQSDFSSSTAQTTAASTQQPSGASSTADSSSASATDSSDSGSDSNASMPGWTLASMTTTQTLNNLTNAATEQANMTLQQTTVASC